MCIDRDNLVETDVLVHLLTQNYQKYLSNSLNCSVISGYGALAINAYAIYRLSKDDIWLNRCEEALACGVTSLGKERLSTSLYRSAPGFIFILSEISQRLRFSQYSEYIDEVATSYITALKGSSSIKIDLIDGLSGMAVMARSLPLSLRTVLLDTIWEKINVHPLANHFLPRNGVFSPPNGSDMGLAHGVLGVISSLCANVHGGWKNDEVSDSLSTYGKWLLDKCSESEIFGALPYRVGGLDSARVGWCYGVLSASVTFAWLSRIFPGYSDLTLRCLDSANKLYLSGAHGIEDDCICHGHSSSYYVIKKVLSLHSPEISKNYVNLELYQHSKSSIKNLNLSQSFQIPHVTNGEIVFFDTLLEGVLGVLLARCSDIDSSTDLWDSLLLLNFDK